MSHWAELDENNIVLRITVGDNNDPDEGYSWLVNNLGGRWIKTSYTSRAGKRVDPDTLEVIGDNHFRYNYAGVGYIYDEEYDAFYPPDPSSATSVYVLNRETFLWEEI